MTARGKAPTIAGRRGALGAAWRRAAPNLADEAIYVRRRGMAADELRGIAGGAVAMRSVTDIIIASRASSTP